MNASERPDLEQTAPHACLSPVSPGMSSSRTEAPSLYSPVSAASSRSPSRASRATSTQLRPPTARSRLDGEESVAPPLFDSVPIMSSDAADGHCVAAPLVGGFAASVGFEQTACAERQAASRGLRAPSPSLWGSHAELWARVRKSQPQGEVSIATNSRGTGTRSGVAIMRRRLRRRTQRSRANVGGAEGRSSADFVETPEKLERGSGFEEILARTSENGRVNRDAVASDVCKMEHLRCSAINRRGCQQMYNQNLAVKEMSEKSEISLPAHHSCSHGQILPAHRPSLELLQLQREREALAVEMQKPTREAKDMSDKMKSLEHAREVSEAEEAMMAHEMAHFDHHTSKLDRREAWFEAERVMLERDKAISQREGLSHERTPKKRRRDAGGRDAVDRRSGSMQKAFGQRTISRARIEACQMQIQAIIKQLDEGKIERLERQALTLEEKCKQQQLSIDHLVKENGRLAAALRGYSHSKLV